MLFLGQFLDKGETQNRFDLLSNEEAFMNREGRILNLLNLSTDLYDFKSFFDEEEYSRKVVAIPKFDINLNFTNKALGIDYIVSLSRGQEVALWTASHHSIANVIDAHVDMDLDVVQSSTSDYGDGLFISKIAKKRKPFSNKK